MTNEENKDIGVGEAAKILGVHQDTIRAWDEKGHIESYKTPGGHRRYKLSTLLEFKEKNKGMTLEQIADLIGAEKTSHDFLKSETHTIFEKWLNAGVGDRKGILLRDIPEEIKVQAAVMLENQRLSNELQVDGGSADQFKRISIPLIVKLFAATKIHKFVSIQPMLGPTTLVYDKDANSEALATQTTKLKCSVSFEGSQDLRQSHSLDAEAELTCIIMQEILMEHERRIIAAMIDGAAFKKTILFKYLKDQNFYRILNQFLREFCKEFNREKVNWIITSPNMAHKIMGTTEEETKFKSFEMKFMGTAETEKGEVEVYADPLFSKDKILVGYRGKESYDAGFVWAPYVLLNQTPVIFDANSFCPRRGIIYRGNEKVVDPTYFATLQLKGMFEE